MKTIFLGHIDKPSCRLRNSIAHSPLQWISYDVALLNVIQSLNFVRLGLGYCEKSC